MRPKFYFGLILLLSFVISGFTKNYNSNPDQLKKEQIIRSINLLRAVHKQPALTLKGIFKQSQNVTMNKITSGGSISGIISGVSGDYIQSLSVLAWSSDSLSSDSTIVNTAYFGDIEPDGSYKISEMEPGEYYVLAMADTYISTYYNDVTDFRQASTVQVSEGETVAGIDFFLEKYNSGQASISGKVVVQNDGHPVANAQVNVFSPDNYYYYSWTETDGDGRYEIIGLKSGKYFAFVWAEGYLNEYYKEAESFDLATPIDVLEPNTYDDIDFTLSRGGMISGKVTNEDGKSLVGIYIQAYTDYRITGNNPQPDSGSGNAYGYGTAVSAEDGSYLITGLSAGDYLVSAQLLNQWYYLLEFYDNVTDINEATPVTVETEVETPGINFDLDVPSTFGSIFGLVLDGNGQPITGVTVQVHAPFDGSAGAFQVWAYGYTDRFGNYRVDNLPDGEYLVSAHAQVGWQYVNRYWPDAETPEKAEPVVVNGSGSTAANFQLPVYPGTASISGQVLFDSGEPIVSAYIQLTFYNNTNPNTGSILAYATTDSSGSYSINQLPGGEYLLYTQYWESQNFAQQWFDHKESRSEATVIALGNGEQRDEINFDLTLRPYYGTIAGNVFNEQDGTPLARAFVEITPIDINQLEGGFDRFNFGPGFVWPYHAITNEQGNYKLEWFPQGEYYVSVYSDGAFEYFEDAPVAELAIKVKVSGGETSTVNFGLTKRNEGNGTIAGRVSDEWNSGELPIAIVIARPAAVPLIWPDSEKFFNTITKTDGSYELTGLPAGEYYLFSFGPGYIGEYYDNVYDPSEAKKITVNEEQPVTGIDFTLSPILWMRGCPECDLTNLEQAGGGQIFGKVTDGNDKVVQNASIYLLDDRGEPVSFAQSNAEGVYELRSVPPGSYRIKATHLNFKSIFNNGATDFADARVIEVGNSPLEINFELDSITGIKDNRSVPKSIKLYDNYPNPFNPTTTIRFDLPRASEVYLKVFNILGEEMAVLVSENLPAGSYSYNWDALNLTSGVYFYRLQAGEFVETKKMILMQ
jgi:protocatechuate 3,4-dioxygenase beta subunit